LPNMTGKEITARIHGTVEDILLALFITNQYASFPNDCI
jgi:hypothetical protein